MNGRPLGAFQEVGHFAGRHVVGRLAVNCGDHVTRPDSGLVRRSADKRRDHDNFVVTRPDRHPDAVVFAALIFTQQRVLFRIKKVGVRI